jgi:hypothetical protein
MLSLAFTICMQWQFLFYRCVMCTLQSLTNTLRATHSCYMRIILAHEHSSILQLVELMLLRSGNLLCWTKRSHAALAPLMLCTFVRHV